MTFLDYLIENGQMATDTAMKLSASNARSPCDDYADFDGDDYVPQSWSPPALQMEALS